MTPERKTEEKASEAVCDWDEKRYRCTVHSTCVATAAHIRVLLKENEETKRVLAAQVVSAHGGEVDKLRAKIEAALAIAVPLCVSHPHFGVPLVKALRGGE